MRSSGFLPKGKEKEFVEALGREATVYAPVEDRGAVVFRPFDGTKELCLSRPAQTSPKSVIFPQNECLFRFNAHKNAEDPKKTSVDLTVPEGPAAAVIFAARPCDAKGFTVFDRVYVNTDTPDPYYKARREKTAIITLACPAPSPGCFCTSVGGSPSSNEGADVLMTEVEGGYFLEGITEKGRALLSQPAVQDGEAHAAAAKKNQEAVEQQVQSPFKPGSSPRITRNLFDIDEFWDKELERCVSCGACTYLCPTCYCFNITDEQAGGAGERLRSWDACMFHHFTLEASGHNPRPVKQNRFRNRVGHKFAYYPEKYDGVIACCGCGRCIRYCPVSIDISEVVAHLAELASETPQGSSDTKTT